MPDRATLTAITETAAGEWFMILALVFGGCCSNVWALEAVLKQNPSSGTFLVFAQFLYVTIQTLPTQLYYPPGARLPRWRKNEVPMRRWIVQVVLFFTINIMNSYAFGLKIPITVHIIFRSGGLCVSMLMGYLVGGKRYSPGQIFAGVVITAGIVLATVSAPRPGKSNDRVTTQATAASATTEHWLPEHLQYYAGIAVLSVALFLSAWLGLWQEQTYAAYGKKWREALFYCHALSMPFFIPMFPSFARTFKTYLASPRVALFALPTPEIALFSPIDDAKREIIKWRELAVPAALIPLALNIFTQGLCIRGVNRLTTRVSSTTVNLILTLRKAASLAISVWYYGSGATWGLVVGGAMVLGGTMIYSTAAPPRIAAKDKKGEDKVVEAPSSGVTTAVEVNGSALKQRSWPEERS